tara:strand:- start:1233 stop:2315 length:1083 start_codon:yes stop_codon:yes gene_type:complete
MYGIDSVNNQVRPNLIYVEGGGPGFRISPEQGKALNLREGQIINGTIALRPEGNAIRVGGQHLSLPAGLGVPGSRVELQVSILAGAYVLRKMGLGTKADSQIGPSKGHLVDFHNSRFERLLRLDQSRGITRFPLNAILSSLFGDGELEEIRDKLVSNLTTTRDITARSVRKALLESGLYLENDLRRSRPAGPLNIKSFLMQIRNAFSRLGKDSTIVTKAIDDLEALQLETLSSQLNRQNSISWALPFLETSPVWLQLRERINKASGSNGGENRDWNLEIQMDLGSCVFSMSLVVDKNRLSLACWVPDQSLYQKIHDNEHILKGKLAEQGLDLLSVELHDFAKIRSPVADTGSRSNIKLDV